MESLDMRSLRRRRVWAVAGLTFAFGAMPVAVYATEAAAPGASVQPVAAQQGTVAELPAALETIDAIDGKIAQIGPVAQVAKQLAEGKLSREQEMLFLRRKLIYDAGRVKTGENNSAKWEEPKTPNAGYDALASFARESPENARFLQWLLSDYETLQLYVTGGQPGGRDWWQDGAGYVRSIRQFMALAKAHADDIAPSKTADPDRSVYKKMMISAALGMNDLSRLWTGSNPVPDPVGRYEIIKTFRANADRYHFQKDLFDALPIENMRWVFENRIANEEMPWLANYTLSFTRPDGKKLDEGSRLNAYTWIEYGHHGDDHGGYKDPEFYNEENLYKHAVSQEPQTLGKPIEGGWAAKYRFTYDDPNFPNKEGDPFHLDHSNDPASGKVRLWMAFEEGGVCGAVSKTCENMNGIVGVPAAVGGQPGHAACPVYGLTDDTTTEQAGDKAPRYVIGNDSGAGWLRLGGTEMNHLPCNWRQVHDEVKGPDGKVTALSTRWGDGTFILMAQDALNDMDGYTKVIELLQLSASTGNYTDKLAAVNEALSVQPANWSALMEKTNLYESHHATSDEWYTFAQQLADACVEYPYPMQSFLVRMEQKAGDPALVFKLEDLRIRTLERAKQTTAKDSVQRDAIRDTADRLLGRFSQDMFAFSFDGPDAGKIKLGPQLTVNVVPWKYSVDGGKTWTELKNGEKEAQLTEEQMSAITAEDDIKVQVIGLSDVYAIDITHAPGPQRYTVNDNDNRFYTKEIARDSQAVSQYEVERDGKWVPLADAQPFEGDQTVKIRTVRRGKQLASKDVATVTFTDNIPEGMRHISHDELRVQGYSSSQQGENGAASVIDGWVAPQSVDGEFWHNTWGGEQDPWITIDLGKQRDVARLDLYRRSKGGNGVPQGTIKVLAAADAGDKAPDAAAFSEVGQFKIGGDGLQWKDNGVSLVFQKPVSARYIKILRPSSTDTEKTLFSISELEFFEHVS